MRFSNILHLVFLASLAQFRTLLAAPSNRDVQAAIGLRTPDCMKTFRPWDRIIDCLIPPRYPPLVKIPLFVKVSFVEASGGGEINVYLPMNSRIYSGEALGVVRYRGA
ncbi:hypothetical protein L228DRAFT_248512 [Xylona heveae TC161]|uniref:Uncharacterized protein n=1 Tax=Xylona heveae (strain CBS 132557 / TC161) TaxID=1328760 RepID=A0A165G5U3_XYLHT|nr:hypothetical protein L228DRAFT_248512 [Xylona heveae TC161]KZF21771.1 hypothetical protein L228DRAFT_248512 [Xylona heveae TC161]